LVRDVFEETGEFCLIQKKKCVKHNNWEKLRRAEIDMERVRQWLKLDELFEKERQIRTAVAQRAGLLPLILHSTFNHELMQQQQYAGQAGVLSENAEAQTSGN
jgi:COMPASS component SPP1